jgi:hypothetical protein
MSPKSKGGEDGEDGEDGEPAQLATKIAPSIRIGIDR